MRRTLWLAPLLPLWVGVGLVRAGPGTTGDEPSLLRYGQRLLDGGYATVHSSDATLVLWHGPGLPALLAPLLALDLPLAALRLTAPLLLFAAVLLFHRLLLLTVPPRWALAGALALGLYLPFGELVGSLHKEPLALVLLVAAMIGATRHLADGGRGWLALAGLSLAALTMTRLEYGWVLLVLLAAAGLWWARERTPLRRRAVAVCALAVAGCLPWLLYTWSLTGRVLYWGNAGGLSLYWMAPHPGQTGTWHAVHTVFADPSLAPFRPFFRRLGTLPPIERDVALQHAAIAATLHEPLAYARNLLANVGRMGFTTPLFAAFNAALLTALAVAIGAARRRRATLPPQAAPFAAFLLAAFAVHLLPSAEPRLAMLLVPLLLWFAVQAGAAATAAAASVSRA